MSKKYVLDTNVLIGDPSSLMSFEENDVVIPMVVIEELDKLKNRPDVGHVARQVSRALDDLRSRGNLSEGVKLFEGGGTLKVVTCPASILDSMPIEVRDPSIHDNLIIAVALSLSRTQPSDQVVLVSKDVNVRIKCDAVGVQCQDYMHDKITGDRKQFYKGVEVFESPEWKPLIDQLYADTAGVPIPAGMLMNRPLYSNQIVIVKDGGQASVVSRVIEGPSGLQVKRVPEYKDVMGLKPKNKEQNFALSLLLDPTVNLVTLTGPSGTGKTLLSIAAGLDQLKGLGESSIYERVIVTRPVQTVGKDLGYLPGTLQEKMDPWITPIKDNLNFLVGYKSNMARLKKGRDNGNNNDVEPYLALLMKDGKIEVEAIPYIRGRSIPRAYLVIDEAQNLSLHELKTIITRSGEGTKVVLTGDIEQIDNSHVDIFTNGLTYAVEKFKEHSIAGHISLVKGERSQLATLASRIL